MQTKKKREPRVTMTTPPGIAMWPALDKPETKFAKADKPWGHYKTAIRLKNGEPEVDKFMDTLQELYDAVVQKATEEETPKARAERLAAKKELAATPPWKQEFDEAGQPTGYTILNLKLEAEVHVDKGTPNERFWKQAPDIFDAKLNPLDRTKVFIGGGSTIRASFEVGSFATGIGAGLSLRLQAVQVLNRVDRPTKDGAAHGFAQQDGFAYGEPEDAEGAEITSDIARATSDVNDDIG